MDKDFEHISSVINQLKKQLGLDDNYYVLISVWEKEIGNNKVELNGFKDGTVFAKTESAVYLHDFNLKKKQLIKRLNQYFGKTVVKNIKCEIK
jgi:endonuclease IV